MDSSWMLGEGVQAPEANTIAFSFGLLTPIASGMHAFYTHSEKYYFGKIQKALLQLPKVELFEQ